MRKFLFATAALMALVHPAMSADMRAPLYKAPPVGPIWSWTGCYVGGHAGGLWAKEKDWIVRTPGGAFFGQSLGGHEAAGWLGGVQAGCDYQFAGGFVIGVQGDFAWAPITARSGRWRLLQAGSATPGIVSSVTSKGEARGSATIIGRRQSCSERRIPRARRARDGRSVSAANTLSPTSSPVSSSTAFSTSAPTRLLSPRKSRG